MTDGLIVVESNTDAWHEERKRFIGASEIGAVLGVDPWKTREGLWVAKTDPNYVNESTFRMNSGHYFEEGIAQMALAYIPELITIGGDKGMRIHDTYDYLSATLDRHGRYMRTDGTDGLYVLDCKSGGVSTHKKLKDRAKAAYDVPDKGYWLQVQQQITCAQMSLGAEIGYLAHWVGGQMFKAYRIEPCLAAQQAIIEFGGIFWDCVEKKEKPTDAMFNGLDDFLFSLDILIQDTSCVAVQVE